MAGALVLQFVGVLPERGPMLAGGTGLLVLLVLRARSGAGPGATRVVGVGRPALRVFILLLLAFGLGFAWAAWRAIERHSGWLDRAWEDIDLVLTGVVSDLPQRFDGGVRFTLVLEAMSPALLDAGGRIQLTWRESGSRPAPGTTGREQALSRAPTRPDDLHAGERWRLAVRLRRPHALLNPHGFDHEALLLERGVLAVGTVRPSHRVGAERLSARAPGLAPMIDRAREAIRDRLLAALPEGRYRGVVIALAIGDQAAIPQSQWLAFNRTGISHLISISGLHVTMQAALAALIAGALWRRSSRLPLWLPVPKAAALAGALAAAVYCALAGFGIPAQRTLAMLSVSALARLVDREPPSARVLAIALVTVVLIDPWAPLTAGFWLSFGAVAMLFHAGSAIGPESGWRAWVRAQGVVTLGLAPLTLALFGQVSLVGPLVNAVAIPVVSLLIAPLSLVAAVSPVDLPARLANGVLELGMPWVEQLAMRSLAAWVPAAPAPWTMVFATAGLAWLLAPGAVRFRPLSLMLIVPMFLPVGRIEPAEPSPGTARVDVLDVGQGLAVVVRTTGHTVLFDTGPRPGSGVDAATRVVLPFLQTVGRDRLDALVVSHPDADHAGGLRSVLASMPVGTLWQAPGVPAVSASSVASATAVSPVADAAGRQQERAPGVERACERGLEWTFDQVRFRFLHPGPGEAVRAHRTNRAACVLRIDAGGHALVLAADIDTPAEARLVERGIEPADALLVPHHGSAGSSSPRWLDALSPSLAVVSAGYRNRFGHPREVTLQRYRERSIRVLRTDLDGAVRVDLSAAGISASGVRERVPRYWRSVPRLTREATGH